jgi:hypothetical protein
MMIRNQYQEIHYGVGQAGGVLRGGAGGGEEEIGMFNTL